jgi:hypothetical protein
MTSTPTPATEAPTTQPLPAGWLACQWCGIGVAPADQGRERTVTASMRENGVPSPPFLFSFTTCPACEAICHRAEDLVSAHPRLAGRIGSDSIAVYRVTAALMALDAAALVAPAVGTDAELADLLALVPPGAEALWSGAFGPVLMSDARPNVGWTERWGHLERDRAEWLVQARGQFATVLRARAERARGPVEVGEPRGKGCLFCGVGSVRVSAAAAREGVWTLHTVSQAALGGRGSGEVSGALCPACEDSIEWVGTPGPTAMERAFRAARGLPPSFNNEPTLSGLVGWGALPGRVRPNAEPWAHLDIPEDLL